MIKRLVAAAMVLCLAAPLLADCTRHAVKKQVVVVYADHYYSLDPHYQQQALAAQIVRQLRAELRKGPVKQDPQVEQGPPPKLEPTLSKYQNEKLVGVINNRCAKCHGNDSKYTRFLTSDGKALNDLPAGKVWEAFGLVNSGEMPKTGDQLVDDDVKLFYDWAKNARK